MLYIIIPIVVLLLIFLFAGYVKAPPNKAAIITGLSKNPRVLLGKSGFKVPFFERVDWLEVGQININVVTEDYIPTKDFYHIKVDAIAQVAMEVSNNQVSAVAMRNFLNRKADDVRSMITESLQGNLREIIGTMDLKSICQDKAKFSQEVKQNAEQDMKELGIRILSFNVQNVNDKDGLIDDLGIDNRETIRKTARVAKANADRDVEVASAEAANKASEAKVAAELAIAQRNNDLEIRKAELKIGEDTKKAEADAAYEIQKQTSRKTVEIREQEADIARREKKLNCRQKKPKLLRKSWMLRSVKSRSRQICRNAECRCGIIPPPERCRGTAVRSRERSCGHPCERSGRSRSHPAKRSGRSRSSGQKGRSYEKIRTGSNSGNDRRSSSGYCKKCGRTIICD